MAIETVHNIYKLWPTGCIDFDEIQSVTEFSSKYTTEEGVDFFKRFQRKKAEVSLKVIDMYAKPVLNKQALGRQQKPRERSAGGSQFNSYRFY